MTDPTQPGERSSANNGNISAPHANTQNEAASSLDPAPYAQLTPDVILDALESVGFSASGSLVGLNSFENRVYQIGLNDDDFVVAKFYRPGRWGHEQILEEHAFTQELLDAELSVVAPIRRDGQSLFEFEKFLFAVFPRQGGHPPEIESEHNLAIMGRTLGRLHALGSATSFQHRPSLAWQKMGADARHYLLNSEFIPDDLFAAYESVTEHLLQSIAQIMAGDYLSQRIHGDCHLGNVLWRDDIPHFVDFDDTLMGPTVQDLWMLLSGDFDERSHQMRILADAYDTFHHFDATQVRLIEALRTLRMLNHAAWIGKRWNDPAFPPAFPWFNGGRYWSDHVLALREQLAAMEEHPLVL